MIGGEGQEGGKESQGRPVEGSEGGGMGGWGRWKKRKGEGKINKMRSNREREEMDIDVKGGKDMERKNRCENEGNYVDNGER